MSQHSWFGPWTQLPAAELLDELERRDGWRLVTIVPVPVLVPPAPDEEAGEPSMGHGYMVLMRRADAPRVVLPH